MSYSTMLRSLPLPLQKALHNPTCLSAIASIAVHGLLWGVLPILPLSSAEPEEPDLHRRVGIVQLTPEELSRVPDFESSTTAVPAVPLPLPSDPSTTGALPNFTLTPLPPQPPIPYSFFPPPSRGSSRVGVSGSQSPRSTTQTTRRPSPSPSPSSSPSPSPSPTPSATPTTSPSINQIPDGRLNNPGTTRLPDIGLSPGNPELPDDPDAGSGNGPETPDEPATENSGGTDEPAGNTPDAPGTPDTPAPDARVAAAIEEQRRLRGLYGRPNLQGTSQRSAINAFGAWMNELGREDRTDDRKDVTVNESLPSESCAFIPQDIGATYGVLVNSDNAIEGEPRLLRRSGYAVFDEEAEKIVADYEFDNETGEDQVYIITVVFQNDRCPDATAPAESDES